MRDHGRFHALLSHLAETLDRIDRRLGTPSTVVDEPLLLDLDRAAKRLSISRPTLERMIRSGAVRSRKIGGRRMVPAAEVKRLAGIS
jgi:excisionase family DNA binding protein